MKYAQIKTGRKLHLVFENENNFSQPICGKTTDHFRMTINIPLANACKNCLRVFNKNGGKKVKKQFYTAIMEECQEVTLCPSVNTPEEK